MVPDAGCRRRRRRRRRPSFWPSRDGARLGLLGALILLYLLCGAAIFSALEYRAELQARRRWDERLANFGRRHGVGPGALRGLLKLYEDTYWAGARIDPVSPRWDFAGAFYFAATTISTIGFGMTRPATSGGKIFLIFYGLFGCAATILFFNLFLERVIGVLVEATRWCRQRSGSGDGLPEGWKPSVCSVALILGVVVLLMVGGASMLFSALEGWGYLESLYFCFVAFSTVGFGDLVSGQREGSWAYGVYRLGNCLLILAGICCLCSLLNIISILIKQSLDWILSHLCPAPGPLPFGLCGCPPFLCGNPSPIWPCCGDRAVHPAPSPVAQGRGLHADVSVDTVCNSRTDVGGRRLSGEMISARHFLAAVIQKAPQQSHARQTGFMEDVGALAVMSNRLQETSANRPLFTSVWTYCCMETSTNR
ncbi:potassium channel subfamily K member 13-like [Anguilla rostrata]|uniref:potassium channel subfamily K member 13-like n=1 Tax=Anguilla rostrata TaxID=7938 RepID=UPI0030CE8011